jgi:hypothetical protein
MTVPGTPLGPTVAVGPLPSPTSGAFETSRVIFQAGASGVVRGHAELPRHGQSRPQSSQAKPDEASDIASEMVDLAVEAKTYTAKLRALRAQHEATGLLIDTLA